MMVTSLLNGVHRGVRLWLAIFMIGGLGLTTACDDDDDDVDNATPVTTFGNAVTVGNGLARSFITVDGSGNPSEIGMLLNEAALTGLPATDTNPPAWYVLELPTNNAKLPFSHLSLDWNPRGHDPAQIYDTPHFDIHFYMMSLADRQQIAPNDPKGEILPDSKFLPANYIASPGVVPMMGKHWVNTESHEFHGDDFTHTFIYGSYNGKVTFLEPMVTLAYLQSKTTETFDLPQPTEVAQTGLFYPTKYTIGYDAATQQYTIKLHDMVLR